MAAIAADCNLLFGLLALQNSLINQVQLVAAFQAWTLDKALALADHLIALGHLNPSQRAAVEVMAELHVAKHGDVEHSLAALPAGRSTRERLAALGDPQLGGTIAHLGSGTAATEEADPDPPSRRARRTLTAPLRTPSAPSPPTASGSGSCGPMPGVDWARSSWPWMRSCTARWH